MGNRKTSKSHNKSDEAKIIYEDQVAKKSIDSTKIEGSDEIVNIGERTSSETLEVKTEITEESVVKVETEVKPKLNDYTDTFLNKTLVKVRVLGDFGRNGEHLTTVSSLINLIVNNNRIDKIILTSDKIANAVGDIILNYPEKVNLNLSKSVRETIVSRFKNNLKRYNH